MRSDGIDRRGESAAARAVARGTREPVSSPRRPPQAHMPTARRDRVVFAAVTMTALVACGSVAIGARAQTGGATIPGLVPPTTGGTGYGAPGARTLVVHPIALLGGTLIARGRMPGAAGRRVVLQRLDERRGWRDVARARIERSARFRVRWRADRSGRLSLRAVVAARARRPRAATAASTGGTPPVVDVSVYRPALATYFGPGLYGNQTACGQTLTPQLHGVAHRTLPCGTRVRLMHQLRELTVPVIDRGPFHAGYSWDLTLATAAALGFTASGGIGYIRERG